jgi:dTMP kinase
MADDPPGATASGGGVLQGATPRAYLVMFRRKPFRNLTLATFSSAMGDWIGFLAIITLTESILGPTRAAAFAVSGVMIARVVPSLLLGPLAGVLVDRWDRKRVLIWTDIGRGSVMALIPFTDEVLTLVLATLLIEVMSALFAPAKDAVFPTLVEERELVMANQVNLITTYGTLPLGAGIYAVIVAVASSVAEPGSFIAERPEAVAIWFNALSFWVSAPLLAKLKLRSDVRTATATSDPDAPGAWEQLKEGFVFVAGHPVIRALILGVMVAFVSAGVVITVGQFFARLLNAGEPGFGILVSLVGIGLVAGLALSAPLTQRVQPERLFAPGIGVAGAALIVTALMPSLAFVAVPALLMGAGAGVSFIIGYTVLQQRSSDAIRGRTFAAFNSGVRFALFSASVAVPALIGVLGREVPNAEGIYEYGIGGVRISLLFAGGVSLLGAVLVGRSLHRALSDPDQDEDLRLGDHVVPLVRHGALIAFEGGDGAGKSTQIRLLRSAVERAGWDALVTREPGGTPLGEEIREVLLSATSLTSASMSDRTEALLYAAARAQHVDEVIRPALEKGTVVLCDRFVDSSVAYQGAARGLGEAQVAELNAWATGGLAPDLVVLLDLEPDEGLRRAAAAADADRIERAGEAFHRTVAAAYRRRAEEDPDRYLVLDARRPVEELHASIRTAVLARLGDRDDGPPPPPDLPDPDAPGPGAPGPDAPGSDAPHAPAPGPPTAAPGPDATRELPADVTTPLPSGDPGEGR